MSAWTGFQYAPVSAIVNMVAARMARNERKNMLRFLTTRPDLADLCDRLRVLHHNPKLDGAVKRRQFARILDDYAIRVTGETTQPATEAAHTADEPRAGGTGLELQPT
jgi:Trp operon repressor